MKKEKKYLVLGIAFSLLVLMGATYAYFTTRIIGDKKNVTIDMAELKVIFTNGDAIEATEVYAEDNLDIIKSFSVENKTKNEYKYNIVIEDLVNTFVTEGYLVYKITSTDGGYNMTEFKDVPKGNNYDVGLAYNISLPAKSIHNYNIEIKYIYSETEDQNKDQGAKISGKLYIGKGTNPSLTYAMLRDNPTISERTDFSVFNEENTTGTLYKTNKTEDGSTVYYYSGNTTNNWVKFGKYRNSHSIYKGWNLDGDIFRIFNSMDECQSRENYNYFYNNCTEFKLYDIGDDMYWRIIRTNEDGSVRLLYSGNNHTTTLGYIGTSIYNDIESYTTLDVGYMYGISGSIENNRLNTNDSTIKIYIDKWYEENLLTEFDKYISKTAVYCNDRSKVENRFSPNIRFKNHIPSYRCGDNGNGGLFETTQAIEDKFSVSTEGGGNGKLKYPIALITMDEAMFVGGAVSGTKENRKVWLYSNSNGSSINDASNAWFWTMSPIFDNGRVYATGGCCYNDSAFGNVDVVHYYVRPVLSIDKCVSIASGDGTPDNPYTIDEGSC